ncbi:MAG: TetR/AcrR family transcriptional regulator [Streptosporangiaceae bacterium]
MDERTVSVWAKDIQRRRPHLTREAVVAAAVSIADAEGISAVSIRRVAAELGARTMSLYTHIESKEGLFDLMADAIAAEVIVPPEQLPDGWREAISMIARREREAMQRHPWAQELVGQKTTIGPSAIAHIEQSLAALDGLGVDVPTAARIVSAVDEYMLGCVIREDMHRRHGLTADERRATKLMYLRSMTAGGGHPHVEALLELGPEFVMSGNEAFEQGLTWLLDGIEHNVAKNG